MDYNCFSAGDFYVFNGLFTREIYERVTSQYVMAASDTSIFAMAIEDSTLYAKFLIEYPVTSTMDATHGFDTTKSIGKDFQRIRNAFQLTMNADDAFTQATAFVMSKHNTGLLLYRRKNKETKFTKINTKETVDNLENKSYSVLNCL